MWVKRILFCFICTIFIAVYSLKYCFTSWMSQKCYLWIHELKFLIYLQNYWFRNNWKIICLGISQFFSIFGGNFVASWAPCENSKDAVVSCSNHNFKLGIKVRTNYASGRAGSNQITFICQMNVCGAEKLHKTKCLLLSKRPIHSPPKQIICGWTKSINYIQPYLS